MLPVNNDLNRSIACALALIVWAFPACGADLPDVETQNPRAVFTQVEGRVTLDVPETDAGVRVARLLQVIPSGATIHVPSEAVAALVCSTDHQILLENPSRWTLTADACSQGRALSAGSYRRIAPRGGRLRSIDGLIAVELKSRSDGDDPRIPVLLSPRDTAVLEGRPTLRWTAVAGAGEYQIELLGRRGSFIERFAAGDVACAPDPDTRGDIDVCLAPYPADRPELVAGETYFLTVGAREGIASPLYKPPYGEPLRRLSLEQIVTVERAVGEVQRPRLANATRWVLLAGIYLEHGLLADAITAYRHALEHEPAPEIRISLGDVYLRIDLPDLADSCYRAAAEASDDPGVEAAAAFGLGQSHLVRRQYPEALEHFRRAQQKYQKLNLSEEAETATQQAAKAERRLRR